jgi:hypothetical protein
MNNIHIKSQEPQFAAAYSRKIAGGLDVFVYLLDSGRIDCALRQAPAGISAP